MSASCAIPSRSHKPRPRSPDRTAAVDLGVRITVSLSIAGAGMARHFEGRELLKDWDAAGRAIAREQARIATGRGLEDRERAPSNARIRHLHRNRRLRLCHGLTAMATAIADDCAAAGVETVYLGWPKNILREGRYGSGKWAGRIHGFWSFGLTLSLPESALEARGITAVRVGERGSSSTCPTCGSGDVARHPRWRLAGCACGESLHSDQAGSRNIPAQQTPGACRDWPEAGHRTATRRGEEHQWRLRSENPRGGHASPSSALAQATA